MLCVSLRLSIRFRPTTRSIPRHLPPDGGRCRGSGGKKQAMSVAPPRSISPRTALGVPHRGDLSRRALSAACSRGYVAGEGRARRKFSSPQTHSDESGGRVPQSSADIPAPLQAALERDTVRTGQSTSFLVAAAYGGVR